MRKAILIPLLLVWPLAGADLGPDLLNAAKKGNTGQVRALLEQGAKTESTDKQGHTALMLAAEHDHPETVGLLVEKGAKVEARDQDGLTAYGLALLNQGKHEDEVLKLLPKPARVRLAVETTLVAEHGSTSCVMTPQQLSERMRQTGPEAMVLAAFREVAAGADKGFVELVAADGDAVVSLQVRPVVACVQQQGSDNLRMEVDVKVVRNGSNSPALEKTFGGGLKGLKSRAATSAAQYPVLFEEFAKAQAGPIYWAVVTALLKGEK